jgi:hypothetical protein
MNPVFQTKFGKPLGNCHAACLASIFEIELDSIPNFGHRSDWYLKFIDWCRRELQLTPIDIDIDDYENALFYKPLGYHLINGLSVSGDYWHSVVGLNGEIAHDPNPDGPALKEAKTYTVFISSLGWK